MSGRSNRIKLTQVIAVNIIESCETFMSFINLLMHAFKIYTGIKIEDHKIIVLMSEHLQK